ncbi:MAG: hypothetical protein ABI068_16690 [Ktedonobacterales bacterium]
MRDPASFNRGDQAPMASTDGRQEAFHALPVIDVSRLMVEAQPIARAAAEVYLRHTTPWFVGLVAHGSALKGGFIAGCSDVDL